jgi:hypothetical protein
MIIRLKKLFVIGIFLSSQALLSAILPEDRADALYHSYDGGGVTVDGPSILVRKKFLDDFSVSVNHYVDMVSSASIDVVTTASKYTEERTQYSVGVDYLSNSTTLSMYFTNSSENDYESNTTSLTISQDFFSNLTTLSIGYGNSSDTVMKNGQDDFLEEIDRQNYRIDLNQIITKNFYITLAVEGITDDGFLNNPYRSVRFLDPTVSLGYSYQPEVYPETKTSTAVALEGKYFLPYRAALSAQYRNYTDTWGVTGQSFEIGYVHPFGEHFIFDLTLRAYKQTEADFYADLFPFQNAQNFLARDKELSSYTSNSIGVGVSYEFKLDIAGFDGGSLNLYYNFMQFKYDNFRDVTVALTPGTEPLYELDANVIRAFVSFYF